MAEGGRQQSLFNDDPVAVKALEFDPTGLGESVAGASAVRGLRQSPVTIAHLGCLLKALLYGEAPHLELEGFEQGPGERSAKAMIPSIIRR